jgi:hypothetical protein
MDNQCLLMYCKLHFLLFELFIGISTCWVIFTCVTEGDNRSSSCSTPSVRPSVGHALGCILCVISNSKSIQPILLKIFSVCVYLAPPIMSKYDKFYCYFYNVRLGFFFAIYFIDGAYFEYSVTQKVFLQYCSILAQCLYTY